MRSLTFKEAEEKSASSFLADRDQAFFLAFAFLAMWVIGMATYKAGKDFGFLGTVGYGVF